MITEKSEHVADEITVTLTKKELAGAPKTLLAAASDPAFTKLRDLSGLTLWFDKNGEWNGVSRGQKIKPNGLAAVLDPEALAHAVALATPVAKEAVAKAVAEKQALEAETK